MKKRIILVSGYAAGGKTVFSKRLSEALMLPVFNKDDMKAVLGNYIPLPTRAESKNLSNATVGVMLHIAENMMKTEKQFILESNFREDETEVLRRLLKKYDYEALSYVLVGDLRVLHKRFIERDNSPERDKANKLHGLLDEFDKFEAEVRPLADFDVGGERITVDTTDFEDVDFHKHIHKGEQFLNGSR